MSRIAGVAAWAAFAAWLALAAAGLALTIATWHVDVRPFTDPAVGNTRDIGLGAVFAVVGLVLAAKRPRNAVGWLLFGVAFSLSLMVLFARYAVYGLLAHPGSLPGASVAASLATSTWVVLIAAILLLVLTFPHGRLSTPNWRIAVWTLAVVAVSTWISNALAPGRLTRPLNAYDNPLGIEALRSVNAVLVWAGVPLMLFFVVPAVSLVLRFRRARGDERQQYKWVAFAAALFPVAMIVTQVVDAVFGKTSTEDTVASTLTGVAATTIPVATAIAILRYRLYEIDRIVSRTVVYVLVTVVLGGGYVGLVLASEAALSSVARGSSVAVALSTLVVAGLFFPVRRRVQRFVDRRFYRSKIDAEATLARFGASLRREADLDALVGEVRSVVAETLAPAHVSLWLQPVTRNDLGTLDAYKGGR